MKRILTTMLILLTTGLIYGQTTYYWVGGTAATTGVTTSTNWNTALNGTGTPRPSSTGITDILVFDGSNLGGATPATGPATIQVNSSISCAQVRLINAANISFIRPTSGTSTVTINGEAGDDFFMEAGTDLKFVSTVGSIRMAMLVTTTGRVSGAITMVTALQARFDNTTAGSPGSFVFTSGASLTTNITSSSSSYAFGSSSQSSEKWVVFEDGSHIYYDGGYSPFGGTSAFSSLDLRPGSTWHHRANNGLGVFCNRKSFGNVIVENNATMTAEGPVYRINNLTVNSGSTFITHSSGQTAVNGNIIVNGTISAPAAGTNELVLAGNTEQLISGSGAIGVNSMVVASKASVSLTRSVAVENAVTVYGKLNFNNNQITGTATFTGTGIVAPVTGTGNLAAGSYIITSNAGIGTSLRGQSVAGSGIAPNTHIVAFNSAGDSVYISNPVVTAGTSVSLTVETTGATLQTANTSGFDPASGSVAATGNKTYDDNINYIIDAATSWPFGVSTSGAATPVTAAFIEINAPVTVNRAFTVTNHLKVNGKIILRPLDIVRIVTGAVINGTPNATNYIATDYNSTNGNQSFLQYEGINGTTLLPVGTVNYYLPATVNTVSVSNFSIAVFEGITTNGAVNGTQLSAAQKQLVVNAVWNINRTSGSGNTDVTLSWNAALEGSTFTTLPNTDIGLITNTGTSWALPVGTGDNTTNTVTATVSTFGSFGAGAVPPSQPFIFNPLPVKTYGDADFNPGATSLNTTQPIVYTSSNTAVATIVAGNIHIVGTGTSVITATQASDGFYPAASATQTLTVNKAALTIRADNKTKFELTPNPALTATYTGFVLGESTAVLLTPAILSTTAALNSAPGTYPITVSGATAANYTITFVNGTLTVQPKQNQVITFNTLATKTYGNADFAAGATSTNSTIPITYVSSNTAVATMSGSNIHIVGAGTTNITASQAGNDGYFSAADVTRALTVNKAALTVKVRDTTKVQGEPNPPFTITYTGFVLGEAENSLITKPQVSTIATTTTTAGYYTLTPQGAASNNYSFTYTDGKLTIYPASGTDKQYLHAFVPSRGVLTVRVFSVLPAIGDIVLYDMSGKPLAKRNLFMPPGFINADLFIPTIPSGIYIVTVKGDGVDLRKTIPIIN
ncbi:MAG TPA: MBG domain-containing protein [Chitinophagaceae bacterium]|nr:MBG domain-containing protein [Chitinophagaceae bacterium]